MPETSLPSRRDFLQATSLAIASATFATSMSSQLSAQEKNSSPNSQLTLGVIGYGNRCRYDLQPILQFNDVRCVAVADVQKSRREAGQQAVNTAYGNNDVKLYADFRELLARKDIDAVLIATGDRWHAAASIMAAEAGKDVYSEKPCGITIADCQRLADTINKTKRVFQAGTQRRSVTNFQKAIEFVHTGRIGKLKKMYASVYRPVLENNWLPGQPTPTRDVVDWNMWLGPVAWRPYHADYAAGKWRGQWDFDSGARILDWGAHTVDLCQWANQADATTPLRYEPLDDKIICTYENGVVLQIDFLDEPFKDRSPQYITRLGTCPVRFEGEDGWIETGDSGEIETSISSLKEGLPPAEKRVPGLEITKHARDFFDRTRDRKLTITNQNVMRSSHLASHAASIAWILGRPLEFNPKTEEFVNDHDANLLKSKPQRDWQA